MKRQWSAAGFILLIFLTGGTSGGLRPLSPPVNAPVPDAPITRAPTITPPPLSPTRRSENATPSPTATATATSAPTGTRVPEIEPPPLPPCEVKWKVVYYHWEDGEWTMKLRCPMGGIDTSRIGD